MPSYYRPTIPTSASSETVEVITADSELIYMAYGREQEGKLDGWAIRKQPNSVNSLRIPIFNLNSQNLRYGRCSYLWRYRSLNSCYASYSFPIKEFHTYAISTRRAIRILFLIRFTFTNLSNSINRCTLY